MYALNAMKGFGKIHVDEDILKIDMWGVDLDTHESKIVYQVEIHGVDKKSS